ncbi:MAG: protoheme IX farnesyltransferase [Chloroflexi bacterium]|nr:protoheme IX farnesyltransferase [Chloroflexota bacterium]MBI3040199.1 protoheme IX farnesyltransferase [Chloroflexota bacterium]MBI3930881.1 protoheme IX farnesyltransferase [Chloroflexota bacterium]
MLLTCFSLAKPRILMLVGVTALASAIVAGQGDIRLSTSVLLLLAGGLASAGASFLNNYFDRDIDAVMPRTQNRPLPEGKVSPGRVLLVGLVLIAISFPVALRINLLTALFVLTGVLVYVALYTLWLKRRTSLNIVFGGLSGSFAALAGWFAATSELSLIPVMIALLLFLWTPSHFWSFALVHHESYRTASIPMLPVLTGAKKTSLFILLSTALLVLVSFLLYSISSFHQVYLIGSVLLGVLFLGSSIRLWMQPTKERAWTNFKFSGVYLFGLLVVMALDVVVR